MPPYKTNTQHIILLIISDAQTSPLLFSLEILSGVSALSWSHGWAVCPGQQKEWGESQEGRCFCFCSESGSQPYSAVGTKCVSVSVDRGVSRACEERRCSSPGLTRNKTPDNIYERYLDLKKTALCISNMAGIGQGKCQAVNSFKRCLLKSPMMYSFSSCGGASYD